VSATAPDPELVSAISAALATGPDLRLAVLFGSQATGDANAASDVDLAVVFAQAVTLASELDLQIALEDAVGRGVDLVRLDEASTLLRWQVACHGIPIVSAGEHEWPRFRARAASEYADFRPALEAAAERFRRRLLEAAGAPERQA